MGFRDSGFKVHGSRHTLALSCFCFRPWFRVYGYRELALRSKSRVLGLWMYYTGMDSELHAFHVP